MKKTFITLLEILYWVVAMLMGYALGAIFGHYVTEPLHDRLFKNEWED